MCVSVCVWGGGGGVEDSEHVPSCELQLRVLFGNYIHVLILLLLASLLVSLSSPISLR